MLCPPSDGPAPKDYTCTASKLRGGQLEVVSFALPVAGLRYWGALYVRADGHLVGVREVNARNEGQGPATRATPPLTGAQLGALVTSRRWDPVLRATTHRLAATAKR